MELLQGCRNQEEAREVKVFVAENISFVIHPDEPISRRAISLLEQHTFSHGLRVVDAIIAASALETASSLATANVKHYRVIAPLNLIQFKPQLKRNGNESYNRTHYSRNRENVRLVP